MSVGSAGLSTAGGAQLSLHCCLETVDHILCSEFGRTIDVPPIPTSSTALIDADGELHTDLCNQTKPSADHLCERYAGWESKMEHMCSSPDNQTRSLDCHPERVAETPLEHRNGKDEIWKEGQRSSQEKLMYDIIQESREMNCRSWAANESDSHQFEPCDLEEAW